mmetsp:Transcript_42317/g.78818  ORF Transcript_42317/g.78818 Transcript_42317/m.78818 type:complete len:208 (-) Transcript_42317:156-779(-)
MHLVSFPQAIVLFAILVCQSAIAFLHVVDPLSIVRVPIRKHVDTFSMHFAIVPVALIHPPIRVLVLAVAMHFSVNPISLKLLNDAPSSTNICHHTFSMPLVVSPLALINIAFSVAIGASTMHLAIMPFTIILVFVRVGQSSVPVDATILPRPFVAVARGKDSHALAVYPVLLPLAFKYGAIRVSKPAMTFSLAINPLSLITLISVVN